MNVGPNALQSAGKTEAGFLFDCGVIVTLADVRVFL